MENNFFLIYITTHIKPGANLFWNYVPSPIDSNWIKVSFAEIFPVVGSGKIVAIIEEKLSVVDLNGFSNCKVSRREIIFYLFVTELHGHCGKSRSNIITVLRNSVSRNEYWKWIATVIGTMYFSNFHRIIHKIVLNASHRWSIIQSKYFTTVHIHVRVSCTKHVYCLYICITR